jgi:hypothetical protein
MGSFLCARGAGDASLLHRLHTLIGFSPGRMASEGASGSTFVPQTSTIVTVIAQRVK